MLDEMLERFVYRSASSFNEFVLDAAYSETNLPHSVEAFFYPLSEKCLLSRHCKARARQVHATFLAEYRLDDASVPLLGLQLDDWGAPFVVVEPFDPEEEDAAERDAR